MIDNLKISFGKEELESQEVPELIRTIHELARMYFFGVESILNTLSKKDLKDAIKAARTYLITMEPYNYMVATSSSDYDSTVLRRVIPVIVCYEEIFRNIKKHMYELDKSLYEEVYKQSKKQESNEE